MPFIKVHTFNSLSEAENAVSQINEQLGIPVNAESVTRTYCEAVQKDGLIYINADNVTESILGNSTQIEVNLPI